MSFQKHCTDASASLLAMSTVLEHAEIQLLALDDRRSDDCLLAGIVYDLNEAKTLSEKLMHVQIPLVAGDEPAVALATRIALQELMRRYMGIQQDLEVMTKTKKTSRSGTYAKVVPILRGSGRTG